MTSRISEQKFRVRLGSLKRQHAKLEQRIGREKRRVRPDDLRLQKMKRIKLHIRDRIARLKRHAAPEAAMKTVAQASAV